MVQNNEILRILRQQDETMLDDIREVFLVTYLAHSDIDGDRDLMARSDQPFLEGIRERAVIEVQGECHGLRPLRDRKRYSYSASAASSSLLASA